MSNFVDFIARGSPFAGVDTNGAPALMAENYYSFHNAVI